MKRSTVYRLIVGVIVLALSDGARAEGFSVGGSLGLPLILEIRVGYEADDFGVRAYVAPPILLKTVVGADAYAKFPMNEYGLKLRVGAGALTDFLSVAFRGVVGFEVPIGPNVFAFYEWRPIVVPSLWFGPSSTNVLDEAAIRLARVFTLLSFSLGLEYRF
jgi:hypothetical protein